MSKDKDDAILHEALVIEQQTALEAGTIGYMARILTQATLPHSKMDGLAFTRKNGNFSLSMIANPNVGLPYGSIPRLLLAWMTAEAVRTKSPVLELGHTLSDFMSQLDLTPTGGRWGSITRLKEQTKRLFTTSISYLYDDEKHTEIQNIHIVQRASLWWDTKSPEQMPLWKSTITLGDDFFKEVTDKPVPLDMRALKALKQSPMALDIYAWLTYRMSYLTKNTEIPWRLLQLQFGADYARERDFKSAFLRNLKSVHTLYPEAKLEEGNKGLILMPSQPHVAKIKPPSSPRLKQVEAPKPVLPPILEDRPYAVGRIILKPQTYEEARKYAPGWDISHLEDDWRYWLAHSSKKPLPQNPDGAFIGFCKKKGRWRAGV